MLKRKEIQQHKLLEIRNWKFEMGNRISRFRISNFQFRISNNFPAVLGLLCCLCFFSLLVRPAIPVPEAAEDGGAMGLSQALKRLDIVASVLHTGAHPDDENSALLAWLARSEGVRTAYLSATRGEGGVNL